MDNKHKKVETLGQIFTTDNIIQEMLSLRKNKGNILEPSCGNGAFSNQIDNCTAIEIDPEVAPVDAIVMDFFDYPSGNKFGTIIGNPPYVKYKNIPSETKEKLNKDMFDERSNLYLFFIEKCIQHLVNDGELIFIVPRDFQKATSAKKLNKYMYENGTFTYFRETGDEKIFPNASLNCVIFRYQKGLVTHTLDNGTKYTVVNGQIVFDDTEHIKLGDIADVKVGAVSGKDEIFANETYGNIDFVCSKTFNTGETRRMIYEEKISFLEEYKDILISRRAKPFNESNWWTWVRPYKRNTLKRVYVNGKTRYNSPFFLHPCNDFDGSILAIFPKNQNINIEEFKNCLNAVDWGKIGFKSGGRYLFSQNALMNAPIPLTFEKFK